MDALKLVVCLMACVTLGAGQSITVAIEDLHLLVETGSPEITFNADIVPRGGRALYNEVLFNMGANIVARPSNQPTGPAIVINSGFQTHFEALGTTAPRVSIKLNNPDMTSHTRVFRWSMFSDSAPPKDVPLIVSDPPVLTLPNEINAGEVTQVRCSVRFGLLPNAADAANRIQIFAFIGSGSMLDPMNQIENDLTVAGVVTRTYTYNHIFQANENGKTFHCEARLMAYPGHKLKTAQQLEVLVVFVRYIDARHEFESEDVAGAAPTG